MDVWVASISNGVTVVEKWGTDQSPPWERLVSLCKENSTWVTKLRMTVCSNTISLPSHAEGYWHTCRSVALEGVPAENLPVVRGIGCVEGGTLHVIWGVRTQANDAFFWHEYVGVDGHQGIIWKPK